MIYNADMRRAVIRVVVIGVVAMCLACPILQMFDHWDHAEAKGKDTESTAMIAALSVGLAIAAAGWAFQTPAIHERKIDSAFTPGDWPEPAVASAPIPVSQPPPILRI